MYSTMEIRNVETKFSQMLSDNLSTCHTHFENDLK